MKYLNIPSCLLLLSLFTLAGCGEPTENAAHRKQIVSVLQRYRDAVTDRDGETATQLLSYDSIKRFEQLKTWALYDTVEKLQHRSLYEQIYVLGIRHYLGDDNLQDMTGQQILTILTDKGVFSTNLLKNARLGDAFFTADKKFCHVLLYENDQRTKNRMTCILEKGEWKVHLIGMEGVETNSYRSIMENKDITEAEFVEMAISAWSQDESTESLWQPLISNPS